VKNAKSCVRDGDNLIQTSRKLFLSFFVHFETNIGTSVSLHIAGSYINRSQYVGLVADTES
jgi:hypothetical protein